jgi:hypothetical protein
MFHVRADLLALGEEALRGLPLALPYDERVYRKTQGTAAALEEALANYVAWEAVRDLVNGWKAQGRWDQRAVTVCLRFIEELFAMSPGGYRDWRLGEDPRAWRTLVSQLRTGRAEVEEPLYPWEELLRRIPDAVRRPEAVPLWMTSDTGQAEKLFGTPPRKEVERFLHRRGYRLRKGKGGHIVWASPDGDDAFSLPTRNPLSQHVFHSLLRHFSMTKQEYLVCRHEG